MVGGDIVTRREPGSGTDPDRTAVQEVTSEREFRDAVLDSTIPAMLAFTAGWCAPCAWLYPYLDEIAQSNRGRLSVLTLDVDKIPILAERYRIASVPIVLLFESGVERARSVGIEPERLGAMVELVSASRDESPSRRGR